MAVTAALVKQLREMTGAGMMDCRKALAETDGDVDKAADFLQKKGQAGAHKKAGRIASEGIVESYIHAGGKVGVLVEVNCESDFVARNEQFQELAHDLCLHIAAMSPRYLAPEDVPAEDIEQAKAAIRTQLEERGKPAEIIEKAVEGRIRKFIEDHCLTKQPFVKNPDVRIEDLLADLRTKTGENIYVKRFARYAIGEDEE